MNGWRQVRAIALLPGNVTITVPALILVLIHGPHLGWGLGGVPAVLVVAAGIGLIAAGFYVWLWTVRLFDRIGRGTLAAWDQTSVLVVEGPYRHVRNPMITAVAVLLVGEALLLGSAWILAWAAAFLAINFIYFLCFEEPGLERRFGERYRAYKRNVPRWVPRASIPGARTDRRGNVKEVALPREGGAKRGSPDVSVGHVTVTLPGRGGHKPPSFSIAREISASGE